uniref:Secreted protein n=1 Tax=Romanomermis culicivorax TaxID=13658 RepID=A0A915JGE8_ROMCU
MFALQWWCWFRASIAMGWTGVDSSMGTGARVNMSSSINFRKWVICMAITVRSAVAASVGRADTSVDCSSFAIFRSKIGVSKSSSSVGSMSTAEVGPSRSSSAVSLCTEAVVGNRYMYTGAGNENRFWKLMMLSKCE